MKKLVVRKRYLSLIALFFLVSSTHALEYKYRAKWGSGPGSGDGQFNNATGIAISTDGKVYVAEWSNHRVQVFTSTGGFLFKWGSNGAGNGQFDSPFHLAISTAGNVVVADRGNHRIQVFTSTGGFVTKWGSGPGSGDGQFNFPRGVAISSSGNVYIADTSNHRVQVFTSTGGYLFQWGSGPGSGDGQFNFPQELDISTSGNVYVTDSSNQRIQVFTSTGGFLFKWGSNGTGNDQFINPVAVALSTAGNVYVVDYSTRRVQVFTSSGGFITKWGNGPSSADGEFKGPTGISVSSSGSVYVTEFDGHRVQRFSPRLPQPIPELVAPVDDTQIDTALPTFDWVDSIGVENIVVTYELQLSTSADFVPVFIGTNPVLSQFVSTQSLTVDVRYYWRVRALGDDYSAWSSTRSLIYKQNSNIEDTDHGGMSWTITQSTTIAGKHTNINIFKIETGVTVTVKASTVTSAPWADANGKTVGRYGWVEIYASSAIINGTFSADGSGFRGGIEGNGLGPGGGGQIAGSFCYSAAGGGYGGRGGNGTVAQGGAAYGDIYSTGTFMGSGGGGGSGVGESGGNGGGAIYIHASYFLLNGTITASGSAAQTPTAAIGSGGLGGGSGGNISLIGSTFSYLSGQIKANGGSGSNSFAGTNCGSYFEGGGSGGGGRSQVLILANGSLPGSAVSVTGANNGTVFYLAKPSLYSSHWSSSDVWVTSVTARWKIDISSSPQKYRVQFSTSADFSLITTSETFNLFAISSDLTPATTIFFRVASIHPSTPTIMSSFVVSDATVTLPALPTLNSPNWSSTDIWATSVTARWNANGNPQTVRYRVEVSSNINFIGSVTSSETYLLNFTSSALTPNTPIAFRVQAIGNNDYRTQFVTSVATYTLAADPIVSDWQRNDVWNSSITARWSANGNSASTKYRVQFATSASFISAATTSDTYNLFATTVGLTPNTTYLFRVKAINELNLETNYFLSLATMTRPNVPTLNTPNWANADVSDQLLTIKFRYNQNPKGTIYQMQFATSTDFDSQGITLTGVAAFDCYECVHYSTYSEHTQVIDDNSTWIAVSTIIKPNWRAAFRIRATWPPNEPSSWTMSVATASLAITPKVFSFNVFETSVTVTLSSGVNAANGSNPPGTVVEISTGDFTLGNSSAGVLSNSPSHLATLSLINISSIGWMANTTYTVTARARNFENRETGSVTVVSSATSANVPIAPIYGSRGVYILISSALILAADLDPNPNIFSDGNPRGGTSYQIQISSVSDFSSGVILSTTYIQQGAGGSWLTGLNPLTVYSARTRAISKIGVPTSFGPTTTLPRTLPAPPILYAPHWQNEDVTLSSATARWQANGNPSGTLYRVEFATSADFSGVVTTSDTYLLSASSAALPPNWRIAFRVQARDIGGSLHSDYVLSVVTATLANLPVLNTPNFSDSDIGVTSVTARWNSNGNTSTTTYRVQFATSTDFTSSAIALTEFATANLEVSSSVPPNWRLAFRVRAENWTNLPTAYENSVTTISRSQAPAVVSFSVWATSLSVTLAQGENPISTTLAISTGNFEVSSSSSGPQGTGNTSFRLTGLVPNTAFTVSARSLNFNNLPSSTTVVGSTVTQTVPFSVSGFKVFTTSVSVTISSGGNPAGTQLVVSTGNNSHFAVSLASVGAIAGENTTLTISGLTPNTNYSIQSGLLSNANGSTATIVVTNSTTTLTAPHSVTGFKVFTTSAAITIGANGNPNGTQIVVSTGSGGNFSIARSSIGKIGGSETTLLIDNLSVGAQYSFQSGSLNADGSTNTLSVTASTYTLSVTPTLIGQTLYLTSAAVTLGPSSNVKGVFLEISTEPLAQFTADTSSRVTITETCVWNEITLQFDCSVDTMTPVLNGLTPNTTYVLRARSVNGNESPSGNIFVVSSVTLANLPGALSLVEATISSITISWTPNSNPLTPSTSYEMQVSEFSNFSSYSSSVIFTLQASTEGLVSNKTYYFRVRAFNRRGVPTDWRTGSFGTLSTLVGVQGFEVFATSFTAYIQRGGNALGTDIQLSTGTNGNFSVALSSVGKIGGDITPLTVIGLSTNTAYAFQTRVVGQTTWTVITVSTYTQSVPPKLVSFTPDVNSISLTLDANTNPSGTALQVSTDNFTTIAGSGTGTSYTLSLTPNTLHTVYGRSVNQNNSPSASAVLFSTYTKAATPANIQTPIQSFTALKFLWSANGNPSGTSYKAELYLGTQAELIGSQTLTATEITFSNLSIGTNYTFYLRALHHDGRETSTISLSTATKNYAPVNAKVSVGTGSYTLSWDSQPDAQGFRVRDANNTLIAELSGTATSFSQSGFTENQQIARRVDYFNQFITTRIIDMTFFTAVSPPKSADAVMTILSKTATSMRIRVIPPPNPTGKAGVRIRLIPLNAKGAPSLTIYDVADSRYIIYLRSYKYPQGSPKFTAPAIAVFPADPPGTIVVDFQNGEWEKEITGLVPGVNYSMQISYLNSDGVESPAGAFNLNIATGFSPEEEGIKAENEKFIISEGVDFVVTSNSAGNGTLKVYGVNQNLVRSISFTYNPGFTRVKWDGKDDNGQPVFTDVYWVVMETQHFGKKTANVAGIR